MGSRSQKQKEQYRQIFEDLRRLLVNHPELKDYFESEDTLLVHNFKFEPFQYRERGLVSQLDSKRQRNLLNCTILDSYKNTRGKWQGLAIFGMQDNSSYFETLTFYMEKPHENKKFKIVELNVNEEEEEIYPRTTPKVTQRTKSGNKHDKYEK